MTVNGMSTLTDNSSPEKPISNYGSGSNGDKVSSENETLKTRRPGVIELGDVTPHNIKLLRRLNQVIFPVSYNAKFYKDVLESGSLAKLAYYNDVMVGAVCCRVDTTKPNFRRLYIMTLGCLASYRRLGIGTQMVEHILDYVTNKDTNFDSIFLHVQVNNQDAIEFYKRFGFEIIETKRNYYKRIEPPDAHVLSKTLNNKNITK